MNEKDNEVRKEYEGKAKTSCERKTNRVEYFHPRIWRNGYVSNRQKTRTE